MLGALIFFALIANSLLKQIVGTWPGLHCSHIVLREIERTALLSAMDAAGHILDPLL